MFGIFRKSSSARKYRPGTALAGPVVAIECLEFRIVPAAINLVFSSGNLTLNGSGADDDVLVTVTGTNSVTLTTVGSTFSGAGSGTSAGPFIVTGDLSIYMGNGDDFVDIEADVGGGEIDSGTVTIDMGANDDFVNVARNISDNLVLTGELFVYGGSGDDIVLMGASGSSLDVWKLTIDTQTDAGTGGQGVYLDECHIGNNLTITQSGSGFQDVQLGYGGANTVAGNLVITQSHAANALGYSVDLLDTSVTGSVTITNGNGTSGATTTIHSTASASIGGTLTLTNGNNTDNSIIIGDNFGGTVTLGQNIAVTNKNATDTNRIIVSLVTTTFAGASVKFTNGETTGTTGTSNLIELGYDGSNSFDTGQQVALENKAAAGSNQVKVYSTSLGRLNITNGTSGGTNSARVGYSGNVNFTGNIVIANGTATTSNIVEVSDLVAGVGTSGNVTITNNTTAATDVKLGDAGSNSILGNLNVTNQATTGLRTTTVNASSIGGSTGVYIRNIGNGNTKTEIAKVSAVTISQLLKIDDGNGDAMLNVEDLTAGSINYTDVNGGTDTIDLGSTGGCTLTVNGTTRVDTGAGADTVNIGVSGSAAFSGLVSILLGAANDSLVIGVNASCAAFSSNNFLFDGGAGSDSFAASPLSIGAYSIPLPGSLTSKIVSFSSLSYY